MPEVKLEWRDFSGASILSDYSASVAQGQAGNWHPWIGNCQFPEWSDRDSAKAAVKAELLRCKEAERLALENL